LGYKKFIQFITICHIGQMLSQIQVQVKFFKTSQISPLQQI